MNKYHFGLSGALVSSTAVILANSAAWAAPTRINNVSLNPTNGGIEVILDTQEGDRPQVFAVPNGNEWVANISNMQLNLPSGEFMQANPAPGIAAVRINSVDGNSVRVTVTGNQGSLSGRISIQDGNNFILSLKQDDPKPTANTSPNPPAPRPVAQRPPQPMAQMPPQQMAQGAPYNGVPLPSLQNGIPSLPPGTGVAPPFRQRAIAPPLGDISVSTIDASGRTINLGSSENVPRLVLRDAPVRDVLALLARVAGMNLAFTDGAGDIPEGQAGAATTVTGRTISLDIENEPVQNVFNSVLQLSGMQANRVGRTIFVGANLPLESSPVITRTLRLNQAEAETSATLLASQGADYQRVVSQTTRTQEGTGVDQRVTEETNTSIQNLTVEQANGPLLLRGLSVIADERLNSITLVGDPRKVEMATGLLSQQDLRRRQVSVNVKVVDINLSNDEFSNSSFSFGSGDSFFVVDGGLGIANFGRFTPARAADIDSDNPDNRFGRPIFGNPLAGVQPFVNPNGTQLVRDPATGQLVPVGQNQPGSVFSPGGLPTTPGVAGFDGTAPGIPGAAGRQVSPSSGTPPLYYDRNGIPRSLNELTVGGGTFQPLINSQTNELVTAPTDGTQAPLYFDTNGQPRLLSQLEVGGGQIPALTTPDGALISAGTGSAPAPRFFDETGQPRLFNELTVGGGQFNPLRAPDGNIVVNTGAAPQYFFDSTGTPRLLSELNIPNIQGATGPFQPLLDEGGNPSPAGTQGDLYFDISGVPRTFDNLTIGGGVFQPLLDPESGLVPVTQGESAPLFFDAAGVPRLVTQILNGQFQPLIDGQDLVPVTQAIAPTFFDANGVPQLLNNLIPGGGTIPALTNSVGELISAATTGANGLPAIVGQAAQLAYQLPQVFQYPQQFLAQLQANIVEGNAKILTDPTLTIQEGETSTINITDRVPTDYEIETVTNDTSTQILTRVIFSEVGLLLPITINRIDDNGFITMEITPEISAPFDIYTVDTEGGRVDLALVSKRELSSGKIRLRDGQTLLIAGVIQDQERESISKLPILGDLPIIGRMFRRTFKESERTEVVVVVTPNIIQDVEEANWGYGYAPSSNVQQQLRNRGFRYPGR
ncbi:AMIN domain-containing protein [Roseofilum sp. BLCC_M154]|uniref:AMIN domain-containing protein n=1 Tax=Roseofilum acuticapitatum BLCC-M154 TaxID=3022444 RepID=A0ABT7AXA9_9CYAN|nr:AMIN domain-containing protein [Roseofilum acuticapitatum]MDJ1171540.1 AMIN domain-containing protein [Roseofilum acuticapitatum BLCC-M154]